MPIPHSHEALLVDSAREIRLARTPAEAERELAGGFRPSVVLLDAGASAARREAFARRVASHPACSAVPILEVSCDDERLRLTLLNEPEVLWSPRRLEELIRILEELCLDLPGAGFPAEQERDPAWSWAASWTAEREPAF